MSHVSINEDRARRVLEECLNLGISEYCVCAGARNVPLLRELSKREKQIRMFTFFEERSAAFFALGRIRAIQDQTGQRLPVAIVTTSGTAAAECLPAAIEAYYQSLPLLLITADRPRRYRGTGAPQSIEQISLYPPYVESVVDFENDHSELFRMKEWRQISPFHLNVCLEEPGSNADKAPVPQDGVTTEGLCLESSGGEFVLKNPLVIVSSLSKPDRGPVLSFLEKFSDAPVYTESTSALSGHPSILRRSVPSPSGLQFESILRLGGVPTCRLWRDLEEIYGKVPVLSVNETGKFPGLSREQTTLAGFEQLKKIKPEWSAEVLHFNRGRRSKQIEAISLLQKKYPQSEQALVRQLALRADVQTIYLGNSLPVRHWDLVAWDAPVENVWANRGANGIDGQLSSFLGWVAQSGGPSWALVGDLTALYDLVALWSGPQLAERARRIVILNNQGGMIFRNLFTDQGMLSRHELGFASWAKMWGWHYEKWECLPPAAAGDSQGAELPHSAIIELAPKQQQTEQWEKDWKEIMKS